MQKLGLQERHLLDLQVLLGGLALLVVGPVQVPPQCPTHDIESGRRQREHTVPENQLPPEVCYIAVIYTMHNVIFRPPMASSLLLYQVPFKGPELGLPVLRIYYHMYLAVS